jgi:hypothetical protein
MFSFRHIALSLTVATLGACSSSTFTPAISGTALNTAGSYSVTQTGTTRTLGPITTPVTGTAFRSLDAPSNVSIAYETADVLAIVGKDKAAPYATYAGISGTTSTTVPTAGTATYNGSFAATYFRGGTFNVVTGARGAFTTNVDFNAGTLTGAGTGTRSSTLSVTGNLQGAQFNGTASFTALDIVGTGSNIPVTGGFYGAGNTVVGIVQNADVAAVFYGN